MKPRLQLLRGRSSVRPGVAENTVGHAVITVLHLSGIECHGSKSNTSSNASAPKKKKGVLKGFGIRRKGTTFTGDTSIECRSDAASDAANDAQLVVWYQQDKSKSAMSCLMSEECIDDEGNIVSWSFSWSDKAILTIPLTGDQAISLGLGVQLPGSNDIQPVGIATMTVPELDRDMSTHNNMSELIELTVDPPQQKRGLSSRFGINGTRQCDYSVSPTTVLKLNVRVDMDEEPPHSTEFTILDPVDAVAKSVVSDGATKSSVEFDVANASRETAQAGNKTSVHSESSSAEESTLETDESILYGVRTKPKDASANASVDESIEAKSIDNSEVLGDIDGKHYRGKQDEEMSFEEITDGHISSRSSRCKHVESDATQTDHVKEEEHLGQAEQVDEGVDQKPVLYIMDREEVSIVSNDLTFESFRSARKDNDLPSVPTKTLAPPQRPQNIQSHQQSTNQMICTEVLTEMVNDAVEGLRDILSWGFCIEAEKADGGDEGTLETVTDCDTSEESTLLTYESTVLSQESTLNTHSWTLQEVNDAALRDENALDVDEPTTNARQTKNSRRRVNAFFKRVSQRTGGRKKQSAPSVGTGLQEAEEQTDLPGWSPPVNDASVNGSATKSTSTRSVKSTKSYVSVGRPATPFEMKVLESKYDNFDKENVSVYSL